MAGIAGLYLTLVSCFCGFPVSLLLIFLISGILIILVFAVIDWKRANRRLEILRSRLDTLPETYLIGETLDRPRDALEMEYYLLMKEISRSAIEAVEQVRAEKLDYCSYVERWVHEIKTPLTARSLMLSNGAETAKIRRELRRADNLTETILQYAKLRTAEKDTQIHDTNLHEICAQAVREEMELLIAADISISIEGRASVYTDPRLLVFILKQLLINCAKYCPGCQIEIVIAENKLTFADNGPGIPSHELSRVTDQGFTGSAGRKHGQSTGMGLYIVRELCKILNIQLEIASKEQQFTRFEFHFFS